jgi:hypothetical protein
MTAQRLLVESGSQEVFSDLYEIINNQQVDEIGLNSPAVHALWTLHGLGGLDGTNKEALQVAFKAMSHPAEGVRKAAVEVLPKNKEAINAIQNSGILDDSNLNVRMHTLLALATMPTSDVVGELLYETSLAPETAKDDWLSKALFAAVIQHEESFLAVSNKNGATASAGNEFNQRLIEAVGNEVYELGRRSTLQFSPEVAQKEIFIRGSVSQRGDQDPEGVIVAHGGKENGYSLYIKEGKLHFIVNQNGQTYEAMTTESMPERYDFVAHLGKNEQMNIEVDGEQVAQAKAPSLFSHSLSPSVRSGRDFGDADNAGDYEGEFTFEGAFQNLTLSFR